MREKGFQRQPAFLLLPYGSWELGTGWEAGPAIGTGSMGSRKRDPLFPKVTVPCLQPAPCAHAGVVGDGGGVGELAQLCSSPNYTRNSPPGYPQIRTALVVI